MFWKRKPQHKRWPTRGLNAPGKYYIDATCMICGVCWHVAPNNCRFNEERMSCEVFKQPDTPEEEAQLRKAMEQSCVQCIHDDGDDKWGQPDFEPPQPESESQPQLDP